jgi:hypothetical protein
MTHDVVPITRDTGKKDIRTDYIDNVHHLAAKVAAGAEGTFTPIAAGSSAKAASLSVALASDGIGKDILDGVNALGGGGLENIGDPAGATDEGYPALVIRDDALGALADAEGDWVALRVGSTGALWATIATALPAGTNAIGKLAANSGVDIGDVDVTSLPVYHGHTPLYADINDAVSGNNTIIAATAAKKIAVWAVMVISDGTVDVRFEDGAGGTAFTGQMPLQEREGFSYSAGGMVPLWVGTANTLLNLELSAAINVHGHVAYTLED